MKYGYIGPQTENEELRGDGEACTDACILPFSFWFVRFLHTVCNKTENKTNKLSVGGFQLMAVLLRLSELPSSVLGTLASS